jgi:hypothetical protein
MIRARGEVPHFDLQLGGYRFLPRGNLYRDQREVLQLNGPASAGSHRRLSQLRRGQFSSTCSDQSLRKCSPLSGWGHLLDVRDALNINIEALVRTCTLAQCKPIQVLDAVNIGGGRVGSSGKNVTSCSDTGPCLNRPGLWTFTLS